MKRLIFLAFTLLFQAPVFAQINGCTDPLANNYNPAATQNDGSCAYNPAAVGAAQSWSLPPALEETSGLIIWDGRIWTHNDDTDIHLYALDTADIAGFQAYELSGTANTDWEEISQDENYVYVGDFGNNANGNRTDLHILRIEKNSLLANVPLIDTIWFSYSLQTDLSPQGPNNTDFDCEAFVVSTDSIYLFTKEWVSQRSSIYALPKTPGEHEAQFRGVHEVQGLITGATYLADKNLIVLCGYSALLQPFLFLLYDFDGQDFFSGNKRKISVGLPFHQVEGIATDDGLTYFISNERFTQSFLTVEQKLHRLDLFSFLSGYLNPPTSLGTARPAPRIRVYPNPVADELTIEAEGHFGELRFEVLNAAGQVLIRDRFAERITLPASGWAPGMYWIRVADGQASAWREVVKR